MTCSSAMGRVPDHQVSSRLCGTWLFYYYDGMTPRCARRCARYVLLYQHDPHNAVDVPRRHRHQHAHSRRPQEQGARLAATSMSVCLSVCLSVSLMLLYVLLSNSVCRILFRGVNAPCRLRRTKFLKI